MATTEELREKLGERIEDILTAILDHFLERGEWIPERALHKRFGGKAKVRQALQEVGGEVVFLSQETSESFKRYELTLLGMLLTRKGNELEALLAGYLAFAREKALQEPKRSTIDSLEAAEGMDLDRDQVSLLGWLLRRAYQLTGGGSYSDREWKFELPENIEEVPEDTLSHVSHIVAYSDENGHLFQSMVDTRSS
jgi:hypothetical protein